MALINCPECNKEISDTVKVCPSCGYKLNKKSPKILIIVLVMFVLTVLAVYLVHTRQQQAAADKQQAQIAAEKEQAQIEVYKEQAQEVDNTILKITDSTLDSISYIEKAKEQYDLLDQDAKQYVTNYDVLKDAVVSRILCK